MLFAHGDALSLIEHHLDALVVDLQDVGSRYYTFQATMLYCLEEASRHGLLTVVEEGPPL